MLVSLVFVSLLYFNMTSILKQKMHLLCLLLLEKMAISIQDKCKLWISFFKTKLKRPIFGRVILSKVLRKFTADEERDSVDAAGCLLQLKIHVPLTISSFCAYADRCSDGTGFKSQVDCISCRAKKLISFHLIDLLFIFMLG